jgi:F-type H+-transporting ATPase subunit b
MNIPLNIDWQQILLHLFNFAILAGGLYILLYKPIKAFMDKRTDYYKDLDDSANAKLKEAEAVKASYDEKLAGAEAEISEKRKESLAKTQAEADIKIAEARTQADKILKDAKINIDREHEKMLEESKKEVANLAVEATKKLLEQSAKDPYGTFLKSVEGGASDDRA